MCQMFITNNINILNQTYVWDLNCVCDLREACDCVGPTALIRLQLFSLVQYRVKAVGWIFIF